MLLFMNFNSFSVEGYTFVMKGYSPDFQYSSVFQTRPDKRVPKIIFEQFS